ncbi:MAG: hypothetical protein F4W90_10515 [Gammaproteobacteria bacterium]|nr:hypothetical protein [Gammaproteobacteria bacterium]
MTESISSRRLFTTADDRTGALEIGGIIARQGWQIPVGPHADDATCCVVDLASRHIKSEEAFECVLEAHQRQADYRCHKMDAGLRGNWPHEIHALVELGYRVAVVASFPDAGRRCKDGVVYIQDVPVLESPFGADPLTAPCSSKPIEVLEEAGCVFDEVEIWDANDNDELNQATYRSLEEDRVLIGPAGAVGSYAAHLFGKPTPAQIKLELPMLVVCGSLNATSREQLDLVVGNHFQLGDDLGEFGDVTVLATPVPKGPISNSDAEAMAAQVAKAVKACSHKVATLVLVGGDTVAALVGDETLFVRGTVEAGIPVSSFGNQTLISKGGGIGTADSLRRIIELASPQH